MAREKFTPKKGKTTAPKTAPKEIQGKIKKPKKPHKFRPGTVALREIRRYQKEIDLLAPKLPFSRAVRAIVGKYCEGGLRIQGSALRALQESFEDHIIRLFENANLLAIHGKRVTVVPRDQFRAADIENRRGTWVTSSWEHFDTNRPEEDRSYEPPSYANKPKPKPSAKVTKKPSAKVTKKPSAKATGQSKKAKNSLSTGRALFPDLP